MCAAVTTNHDAHTKLALSCAVCAGFLITYDKIPNWLVWLFYISPFSWSVQSLMLNEFGADKYSNLVSTSATSMQRIGDVYIERFGLRTDQSWKWMGPVYLVGFYFFFASVNAYLLSKLKPITPIGTRKTPLSAVAIEPDVVVIDAVASTRAIEMVPVQTDDAPQQEATATSRTGEHTAVQIQPKTLRSAKHSFQLTALPFVPVTLAWRSINYSVEVGSGASKHWRQLLTDISGFAAPGRMTALMGSSGAGQLRSTHTASDRSIDRPASMRMQSPFTRVELCSHLSLACWSFCHASCVVLCRSPLQVRRL
jgi:hypothetical protein